MLQIKILRVLFIGVVILIWNGDLPAFSQQKIPEGRESILLGAAALGATLGAFSVGFFEYHSTWFRLCHSRRDQHSLQDFLEFVLPQHAKQYPWEEHGRKILGSAIGATAGLVLASQMQGLAGGNTPMALAGGIMGIGAGLGLGCLWARIPRHDPAELLAFELMSTATALGFAAVAAVDSYDAQSPSNPRASRQPTSSAPTMSVTLWSLRF